MGLVLDKAFNAHRDKTREGQRGTCMASAHDITKNQRRRLGNLQKRIPRNHERGATGHNTWMSHANPTFPFKLFKCHYSREHKLETCPSKLQCRFVLCSYRQMKAKIDVDEVIPQASRTQRICDFCNVNLCAGCFAEYHQHK